MGNMLKRVINHHRQLVSKQGILALYDEVPHVLA